MVFLTVSGINVIPGSAFHALGTHSNYFALSISTEDELKAEKGFAALAEVLRRTVPSENIEHSMIRG